MIVKSSAINGTLIGYFVEKVWRGEVREVEPVILEGNREEFERALRACPYKQKATSTVYREKGLLTDEQCDRVMKMHNEAHDTGLAAGSVQRIWIKHEDKGDTELHCLEVEQHQLLQVKMQNYLNVKTDRNDLIIRRAIKTIINHEFGNDEAGRSPDDPANKRIQRDKSRYKSDSKQFDKYDAEVCEAYRQGLIFTPEEAAQFLKENFPEIKAARPLKRYVALEIEGREQPLRLKGIKYESGFDSRTFRFDRTAESARFRAESKERAARARADLERALIERAKRTERIFGSIEEQERRFRENFSHIDLDSRGHRFRSRSSRDSVGLEPARSDPSPEHDRSGDNRNAGFDGGATSPESGLESPHRAGATLPQAIPGQALRADPTRSGNTPDGWQGIHESATGREPLASNFGGIRDEQRPTGAGINRVFQALLRAIERIGIGFDQLKASGIPEPFPKPFFDSATQFLEGITGSFGRAVEGYSKAVGQDDQRFRVPESQGSPERARHRIAIRCLAGSEEEVSWVRAVLLERAEKRERPQPERGFGVV